MLDKNPPEQTPDLLEAMRNTVLESMKSVIMPAFTPAIAPFIEIYKETDVGLIAAAKIADDPEQAAEKPHALLFFATGANTSEEIALFDKFTAEFSALHKDKTIAKTPLPE